MFPVLLRLGPVAVYTYPLVLLAAVSAGGAVARSFAKRAGITRTAAADLVLAFAIGALAGARLWHAATFPHAYAARWWRVFELQTGGLVFYGAVAGGLAGVFAYAWLMRLRFAAVADVTALALPLGGAIGRIGCLAAGCCGGRPVIVGPVALPTQLVDAFAQLAIFAVLLALARGPYLGKGLLAAAWLVLYPAARFGVEFLRGDARVLAGLTQAQVVSVPLAVAGILVLVASRRVWWPSSAR